MVAERTGHGARWRGWAILPCALVLVVAAALGACGGEEGDTGSGGVRVVVTYAAPTDTPPPRSLTQPASLPTVSPVAFPTSVGTITNVGSTQLTAGVKARVKDSADGLSLREQPSTRAKVLESLAAGAELNVLGDPADVEGRTWVKVSFGSKQGYVAAEFVERK